MENVKLNDSYGNRGRELHEPVTEEAIRALLSQAHKEGLHVAVESGGTKRGYGGANEGYDWTLSLKKYRGIVEHNAGDMTITVKPGTTIAELQRFLQEYGQQVSLDPHWPEQATIGGVISANESGPKRLAYGSARDLVIGLRVVYPDGRIIRTGGKVVKNVAGYDMNKLFIGAMGTLGVISEITMKLRPAPKYRSLVQVSVPEGEEEELRMLAVAIQDAMIEPVTLEIVNPAMAEKLTGKWEYMLLVAFEDVERSVHEQEGWMTHHNPEHAGMEVLHEEEAGKFWERFAVTVPNAHTEDEDLCAVLKAGTKNMDVFTMVTRAGELGNNHGIHVEAHGGLGHGISECILRGQEIDVTAVIEGLRAEAGQIGGYVVIKHLPVELRKKMDAWGRKPGHFSLLEGIKKTVDPHDVCNLQRYIGGI
ncbi:FAD-binding oxidoreductase [Halobacillus litoralis]|uniref:FAD-binding oxidoreductase n=1 Tax=Halobacillus litoralis TaxID=45668 RepID=UPI001CD762E6|nr:FAD-binding oxidoreductase [Halobacillus litoralis]MCA1023547.1 FAD-binding oxidoreductase [Halobacillus litoralis]